ncbi:MAG TPA: trypsin-like peptidase domain-containing protein [Blastocatellia bacterium]|nr:trypsin-like peptidase domain-containing protein [Blastocatellia bacterium]
MNRRRLASTAALAVWAAALLVAPGGRASWQSPLQSTDKKSELSAEARERVRQAVAAVGLILVRRDSDGQERAFRPRGSAVIVRSDGVVVTNYHVIAEDRADRLYDEIYFSLPSKPPSSGQASKSYRLQVVAVNKAHDLALLQVASADAAGFPAIEIGDSRAIKLLDDLIIIGFPEKGGATVTVNTALVEGTDLLGNWIKTDGRLIHGNSGGAAVNSEGKLIGIPTKVLADRQPVDKDGDGFPDDYKWLGAVGFLRPAYLVDSMLAQLREQETRASSTPPSKSDETRAAPTEAVTAEPAPPVTVRGIVKSASDGKTIAGARVGLTLLGSLEVTANNLLTWGGTNGDGEFELNKPVPPGRYTLKAKAISYEAFTADVTIDQKSGPLVIELRPSP